MRFYPSSGQNILSDIVDDTEKARLSLVNKLFCGMHVIDGLAHQVGTTLAMWESLIFQQDKVGNAKIPVEPPHTHIRWGE